MNFFHINVILNESISVAVDRGYCSSNFQATAVAVVLKHFRHTRRVVLKHIPYTSSILLFNVFFNEHFRFSTLWKTSSFLTSYFHLIFNSLRQHHISELSKFFLSPITTVRVSQPYNFRHILQKSFSYFWFKIISSQYKAFLAKGYLRKICPIVNLSLATSFCSCPTSQVIELIHLL